MELTEMKEIWEGLSQQVDNQQLLTDTQILDMTKEKYQKRLQTISTYETLGAVACFALAGGILLHIGKLDNWYLLLSGIISIAILIGIPLLTLSSLWKMEQVHIQGNDLKQTLIDFTRRKNHFLLMQRLSIYFSFFLLITCLPVAGKILSDKDILLDSTVWQWYIPMGTLFLFLFARWGYRCYENITHSAEGILKEWEEQA